MKDAGKDRLSTRGAFRSGEKRTVSEDSNSGMMITGVGKNGIVNSGNGSGKTGGGEGQSDLTTLPFRINSAMPAKRARQMQPMQPARPQSKKMKHSIQNSVFKQERVKDIVPHAQRKNHLRLE